MFIRSGGGGYNRHGEQSAAGLFLALFTRDDRPAGAPIAYSPAVSPATGKPRLWAAVRHVRLRQFGHFMMGRQVFGVLGRLTLSGAYGRDGLPGDVTPEQAACMVEVPDELAAAFWAGGGWNSSGSEAPAMRAWALANLAALRASARGARK